MKGRGESEKGRENQERKSGVRKGRGESAKEEGGH